MRNSLLSQNAANIKLNASLCTKFPIFSDLSLANIHNMNSIINNEHHRNYNIEYYLSHPPTSLKLLPSSKTKWLCKAKIYILISILCRKHWHWALTFTLSFGKIGGIRGNMRTNAKRNLFKRWDQSNIQIKSHYEDWNHCLHMDLTIEYRRAILIAFR